MKIAISAVSDNLDSMMDPRFGRAAYFLIVDSDTLEFQSFINPHLEARGGAGVQSAQFVLEKGAQAVITGSCGPNAYRVLETAGIPIFETPVKVVREQLQAFQEKRLPNLGLAGRDDNHLSSDQRKWTHQPPAAVYTQSPNSPDGPLQDKISRLEERLQEINQRLETLEKQRENKK